MIQLRNRTPMVSTCLVSGIAKSRIPFVCANEANHSFFILHIEFLLGSHILVAPVIEQGAVSRDIYLPKGDWFDRKNGAIVHGPTWLMDYAAPLDVLPYFIRQK